MELRQLWMMTWALAIPLAGAAAEDNGELRKRVEQFFRRSDKDGDGKLSREEYPERVRRLFARIDSDGDGVATIEEDLSFRRERRAARRRRPERQERPPPDDADVRYGPHDRNVFDLWRAKSEKPAPLVIYYHGGGFRAGDKRSINPALLDKLLKGGVSVAAANYRLSGTAPFPAQMHDCARALQFIRHHASKYSIDPRRIGATGGSAGAGISMWLAFHDDLADPASADPVSRQSTRISAAVVYAAQSSYDPRFIKKLFNTDQVHPALISFFGMKGAADVDDPKFHAVFREASPITHVSAGDAPVMLYYPQANKPLPPNSSGQQHIHHPKFGFVLKDELDRLGVECVVKLREDYAAGASGPEGDYVKFFFDKLKLKSSD